jgi:hypothetical protein
MKALDNRFLILSFHCALDGLAGEGSGFIQIFRHSLPIRLLKKLFSAGCSKMPRCKAPEILRNEAYLDVRRNDEGPAEGRGNEADGLFSAAC